LKELLAGAQNNIGGSFIFTFRAEYFLL